MPKRHLLSYLAGIFDGEGCVAIEKHRPPIRNPNWNYSPVYQVLVQVSMTDHPIPRLFQSSFGGSVLTYARAKPRRVIATWHMTGTSCIPFLNDLLPYVIIKRPQFEVALHLLKNIHRGRREHLSDEELVLRETDYILCKKLKMALV